MALHMSGKFIGNYIIISSVHLLQKNLRDHKNYTSVPHNVISILHTTQTTSFLLDPRFFFHHVVVLTK